MALSILVAFPLTSCSRKSVKENVTESKTVLLATSGGLRTVKPANEYMGVSPVWTKSLPEMLVLGGLSMNAARQTLIIGNREKSPEIPEDIARYLALVDEEGEILWQDDIDDDVKNHDLGDNFSVLSLSSGQLILLDSTGDTKWTLEKNGVPKLSEKNRVIVLMNDNDADPSAAYEIIGFDGKTLKTVKSTSEILLAKVSPDGDMALIAFSGGDIRLLDLTKPGFPEVWKKRIEGEIVDASISGKPWRISVLANIKRDQSLYFLDVASGGVLWSKLIQHLAEQ
ncbi:MAG: hypothetical protein HQK54_18340, partial [Oligoflexales bacterium]|nr:hypothetical protein [Oligoflexales bacterium]